MAIKQITVMLVDDHMIVRAGARRLLEMTAEFQIVAEADSGEKACELHSKLQPDVTVMDIHMPGMGGIEAMIRILTKTPQAKIIILSMYERGPFVAHCLKAGAKGYLTKASLADELSAATRAVAMGRNYMSSSVAQSFAIDSVTKPNNPLAELNAKEFQVFRLIAEGKEIDQIADALKLSTKTIANYQSIIKRKLSVNTSIEILKIAIQYGLLDPENLEKGWNA
jgi:two-component system invasion response regulator UvrY